MAETFLETMEPGPLATYEASTNPLDEELFGVPRPKYVFGDPRFLVQRKPFGQENPPGGKLRTRERPPDEASPRRQDEAAKTSQDESARSLRTSQRDLSG